MTLLDTGPLVALLDPRDAAHERCVTATQSLSGDLLTTPIVIAKAAHLLGGRVGVRGVAALSRLVRAGPLRIAPFDDQRLERAALLIARYRNVPMDLGDASVVVEAEFLDCRRVFTLDRDFQVYRIRGRTPFEIVPNVIGEERRRR